MAKNDQEEAFEKALSANLSRSIEMLKYAEAKNAALLTFCSAWIIAFLNLINARNKISDQIMLGISISTPILALSAIILIVSFLPRSKIWRRTSNGNPRKNLLYFADIANIDTAELQRLLYTMHLPPADHSISEAFVCDIVEQIHAYSKVANRKFRIFAISATLIVVSLTNFGLFLIDWRLAASICYDILSIFWSGFYNLTNDR